MQFNIFAFGKIKEQFLKMAQDEYQKRLGGYGKCSLFELKPYALPLNPSNGEISKALEVEGQLLLSKLPTKSVTVAMCVEGKVLSSLEFSGLIGSYTDSGVSVMNFLVGSSYGLSQTVKNNANIRLSFSNMTFPHDLFRIMLYEQLYRAENILSGGKYNK